MMISSGRPDDPARRLAHTVLTPKLDGFSLFDFGRLDELVDRGREAARAALPQLRELLSWELTALHAHPSRGSRSHRGCNMFSMSVQSLRELRANLGAIVRDVAYRGDEVIVTDSGTEIAVIISMGDYERLHEHADVVDALRLRELRRAPFTSMTMAQMLEELGVDPAQVHAS